MIPYLFALFSAFCFGISNTYWKTASKNNNFSALVFFRGIIASICFGITWIILIHFHVNTTLVINTNATVLQYLKTGLLCMVCSLGLVFFLLSLKYSLVSISVPLSSLNIFSILTAVFVLGEPFRNIYFISFGLGITGVLLTQSFKITNGKIQWNRGASYALLASIFWGTTYALFKFSATWLGAIPLAFILEFCVTIAAFIWMFFSKNEKSNELLSIRNIKHYFILAALLVGGTLFFNLAIQKIPILVINILGNFTFVVSIVTGILIYKENLSAKQIWGVCLILASIIIVQIIK